MAELLYVAIAAASAAAGAYAAVRVELRLIWRELGRINRFIGRDRAAPAARN